MTNLSEKQRLSLLHIDISQLVNTILLYYLVGLTCDNNKLDIILQEVKKSIIDTLVANGLNKEEVEKTTTDVISNIRRMIIAFEHGRQEDKQCK